MKPPKRRVRLLENPIRQSLFGTWLVCQRFFIFKMGVISVLLDRDLCGCVLKKRVHVKLGMFNYEREVDT